MPFPELVDRVVRPRPFGDDDQKDGLNWEVLPTLNMIRARLNELLLLLRDQFEPALIGSSAFLYEQDGLVIVTEPGTTLTLPSARTFSAQGGHRITFRNKYSAGVGDTTIVPAGDDTIEGLTSFTLAADGTYATLVSVPTSSGAEASDWIRVG